MITVELIYNLALLVVLSVLSGFIGDKWKNQWMERTHQGILFGSVAIIGMLNPVDYGAGLIFDGRSVLISLCGILFGPVSVVIASIMAITLRLLQGGIGTFMGVSVILSSAIVGLLFYYRITKLKKSISYLNFYILGLLVHLVMILLMFTFPKEIYSSMVWNVGAPVIIIYPVATLLIGKLISDMLSKSKDLEMIRKSEEKYKNVIENINEALIIENIDGKLLFANQAFCNMFGYDKDEFSNLNLKDYTSPKSYEEVFARHKKRMSGVDVPKEFEYEGIRKDGTTIYIAAKVNLIKENGKIVGTQSLERDITARKQSETELQENKQENDILAAALRNINDCVTITDDKNNLIFVNDSFLKVYGYCKDEVIGKNIKMVIPDDNQKIDYLILEETLKGGWKGELINRRKDGTEFPISLSTALFKVESTGTKLLIGTSVDISERIKAENALKSSEERFRLLYTNAPLSYQSLDINARLIDVNPQWLTTLGYDRDEVLGHPFTEFMTPESAELAKSRFPNFLENGEIHNHEFEMVCKDKSHLIVIYDGKIANDESGNFVQTHCIFSDITKNKEMQKDLSESEKKFRSYIDNSPDGIFVVDEMGNYVEMNTAGEVLTGYTSTEIKSKSISDLTAPESIEAVLDHIKTLKETGKAKGEFQYINKSGKKLWWSVDAVKLSETRFLGFTKNITARKLAELSLIKSEEKFRLLFENLTSGFALHEMIYDDNGNPYDYRYIEINPAFEKLTGARAANLIGHTVKEVMPNTEQYWIDTYGKVAKYGIPISYENYAVEIGKYFDVWAFSPEKDKFAVIFSDTTERKQAEELLRLKNKEFEAQYEEYMQLNEVLRQTNYDLEIAKQRAEESDKLKTAFLQNMSHEIRTPLNGILGFSKLLTDSNLTKEEITEFTSIIHQSGIRLLDLVNNVLDISKIETKQIEVNLSNFSINSLISDLYSFFIPLANTNKLSINYNTTLLDQESIILSDEGKIHQVLSNLISNAIKFTPSGSIDYGYNIENDKITFFVKDTGIGITKHLHEKIFRRFVQAEDTIGRNYEGAGLGLAICKGLVEMMGGTIWIDSEIGNGSTFYFSIPYFSVSLSDYENPAKQSNLMTSTHYKILIAEDDFTSYRVLSRVLENNNFIVLHAENGSQAIDLVNEHPDIALILMDIRMPVMDGMEATKRIKILRADIPIIAQTAYAFSDEKEKILSIGCDDYISKPIEIDKLSKLISKYLK